MANFRQNQGSIREMLEEGLGNSPLAKIHEHNMAMMKAATEAFMPSSKPKKAQKQTDTSDGEIAALREQMAQMQKKLDELGK